MYINLFEDESNKPVFGADIQVQKLGEELTWRQKNVTSDPELGRHDLYRVVPCALLVSSFLFAKIYVSSQGWIEMAWVYIEKKSNKVNATFKLFIL